MLPSGKGRSSTLASGDSEVCHLFNSSMDRANFGIRFGIAPVFLAVHSRVLSSQRKCKADQPPNFSHEEETTTLIAIVEFEVEKENRATSMNQLLTETPTVRAMSGNIAFFAYCNIGELVRRV